MYSRWAVLAHVVVFVFRLGAVGHSTANLVWIVPNNLMMIKQDQELIPSFFPVAVHFNLVWDHHHHSVAGVYLRVVSNHFVVEGSPQVVAIVLHLAVPALDSKAPGDLAAAVVYVLSTWGGCKVTDGTTTHRKKGQNVVFEMVNS